MMLAKCIAALVGFISDGSTLATPCAVELNIACGYLHFANIVTRNLQTYSVPGLASLSITNKRGIVFLIRQIFSSTYY